jgi:hypothetical protein
VCAADVSPGLAPQTVVRLNRREWELVAEMTGIAESCRRHNHMLAYSIWTDAVTLVRQRLSRTAVEITTGPQRL